ncbi:toll/interleukin-1 receptor domain-containing protein [Pseudomonas guariconensis]|uniref:toll/interleukin-1 receptor domain-containing protein n=1 Tax=Pseudomonas guariconensis TaxID=1288410 RepID=UPI0018D7D1FD|nr:toll/interleukin-1 receptor domain-containing protein [Pseudomonas guariconensis]MBH3356731.1 toll/interleukin-1 receptor domain-containing protein [Pseudomonas guariconensis]
MTTEEKGCSIFISYAWGSEFRKKEWIRQDIVSYLEWRHDVFWDRDTIALGDLVTDTISKGLAKRPLLVLCLCDQDYLEAAKRVGGGLHDELRMLAQIVDEPGVRVVPLILESGCSGCLPAPLADRLYLDLQPLYRLNLSISTAIWGVAEGLGQAQLQREINAELALFHLRQRALGFLKKRPLTIWGNGQNHQVEVQPDGATPYLLKPPQWMWDSNSWNYLLDDDEPTFCPSMGRWHWEHVQISTEMRPLGAAVISMFFPQFTEENEKKLLNRAATLLASKFFRMVKIHESFSFDVNDLVNNLTCDQEGCNLLQQLLDAAGVTPAAG